MKEKILILITGQKSRLELKSKVKYIIEPLCKVYDILVVLSLSDTRYFTNIFKYKEENVLGNEYTARDKLMGHISYCENDIIYPDLHINNNIVSMYDKKQFGQSFRVQRAENHIRQYYTSSTNWEIVKKFDPDILIKIRDDAILSSPIDMDKVKESMNSDKTIVTPCKNSWGGINDKFAIVSKQAIETYLKKPFEVYNSYKTNDSKKPLRNPEQFLSFVYKKYGISLLVTNIDMKIMGHNK